MEQKKQNVLLQKKVDIQRTLIIMTLFVTKDFAVKLNLLL